MSKLVEQLKNLGQQKNQTQKDSAVGQQKNCLSEHLTKTYFPSAGNLKKNTGPKQRRLITLKKGKIFFVIILVVLTFSGLFLLKLNQNYFKQASIFNAPLRRDLSAKEMFNKIDLEQFFIYGDSGNGTSWTDNHVVLVNGRNNKWANLTLKLKKPIDLTNNFLTFRARGLKGSEKFLVTFSDKYFRPNPREENVAPLPEGLSTDWQQVKISLKRTSFNFNPAIITKIRFEFGTQRADNQPGATIYLTDLGIVEKYLEDN